MIRANEKLIYKNNLGDTIELSIVSDFFLEEFDGRDSIKNNIYTVKNNIDGSDYINSTLEPRYIHIVGRILGDKLKNKDLLIKIFNPKLKGTLSYFLNNNFIASITCYVDTTPKINLSIIPTFSLSLLAPNPYWNTPTSIKKIAMWTPKFSFPCISYVQKPVIFGVREPNLIAEVNNPSDVKTGVKIVFKAIGTVVNPCLINVNTLEFIKINKTMVSGEVIEINTNTDEIGINVNSNGLVENGFKYLDVLNSNFLQLEIGKNIFRYDADKNLNNLNVDIIFNPKLLGV